VANNEVGKYVWENATFYPNYIKLISGEDRVFGDEREAAGGDG
jgi:hypothetical protein